MLRRMTVRKRRATPVRDAAQGSPAPHRSRAMRHAAALAFAAAAAISCSLALETRPRQCDSTDDCRAKGAAFAASSCVEGMCVQSAASDGGAGSNADAAARECTTHKACIAKLGEDAICRPADGLCAALRSTDCTAVLAPRAEVEVDDALVLGALLPATGALASTGAALRNSIQLAVSELRSAGGLPPARAGGPKRPVVVVACDDAIDPVRAATHLALDLRVPAILGAASPGATLLAAQQVGVPRSVLLLTPSDTTRALASVQSSGLVWRTAPSDAAQALALAKLATDAEQKVRAKLSLAPSEPVKLAVAHRGDTFGVKMADDLEAVLTFNGKSAAENGASYLRVDYGDPTDPQNTNPTEKYDNAYSAVLNHRPHVLALLGALEGVSNVYAPVEKHWTPAWAPYKPRVLFADRGADGALLQTIGKDDEMRQRILGTRPGTTRAAFSAFASRYAAAFTDGTSPDGIGPAGAYDATLLASLAAVGAAKPAPTGPDLLAGLKKLVPPGTKVALEPSRLAEALALLAQGTSVDVDGASGPLDFETATGNALSDIQVWCVQKDASGSASGFQSSGQYLKAESGQLEGTLACP
jgi:branched-chain amino acid transport system substrate-binding protein